MAEKIVLKAVAEPARDCPGAPVALTDETMRERLEKILSGMKRSGLEVLVVYGDVEHGSNFEYLVGFLPRFEEALLVLHADGKAYLVVGNENLNKVDKSRLPAEPILCSYFSLPNQPMQNAEPLIDILARTGITGKKVGIAGWKHFTSRYEDNSQLYDLPSFILDPLRSLCASLCNATELFIGADGARVQNNPNEIVHYEFGASLASDCILDAMDGLKPGISEMAIGDRLNRYGQHNSVVTIAAFGPRFIKANLFPTTRQLAVGDTVSITVGYKGGLSSRNSLAVENSGQIPQNQQDYVEKVCVPYFNAIRTWLETAHVGMSGGMLYEMIDDVLPRSEYHWKLCPGHLTADEEWMSSPVYEGSQEILKNGSLFQTDIIPSVPGYPGVSMESTCLLADQPLRQQIARQYPDMWRRAEERRRYTREVIGIQLNDDVVPLAATLGYLKPYLLSNQALVVER